MATATTAKESFDADSRLRKTRFAAPRWLPALAGFVGLAAFWELLVRLANVDPTLWTPPSQVAKALPRVVGDSSYWEAILSTLGLLAVGFALSAVLGIAIGLFVGRVRIMDRALTPWINGVYSTPLPAVYPVITAAVGFGFTAKLTIVFALAVFPIMMNTYKGVTETDHELLEVAKSFRANEAQLWRNLLIPFALPFIMVGLRLGVARALIGTVIAEFFTSPGGLGYEIVSYSYRFDVSATMVVVLTLSVMGVSLMALVRFFEGRLVPWRRTPDGRVGPRVRGT